MQSKRWANAINSYSEVIRLLQQKEARDPMARMTGADTRFDRAYCYRQLGRLDEALADLDADLAVSPNDAGAWLERASIHLSRFDGAKAAADFTSYFALHPTDYEARIDRATAYREIGEFEKARADIDLYAAKVPNSQFRAALERGAVAYQQKSYIEAVVQMDEASRLAPGNASCWYVRGLAKKALGDAAGGDADIAKALKMAPTVGADLARTGIK